MILLSFVLGLISAALSNGLAYLSLDNYYERITGAFNRFIGGEINYSKFEESLEKTQLTNKYIVFLGGFSLL